jgi:hypothetical protein
MSRTIQEHAHPATPKIQHRVETGVKGISLVGFIDQQVRRFCCVAFYLLLRRADRVDGPPFLIAFGPDPRKSESGLFVLWNSDPDPKEISHVQALLNAPQSC